MYKFYRRFTYLINSLFFIGFLISIFELITREYVNKMETLIVNSLLIIVMFSSVYFISKTKKINVQKVVDNKTIDAFPIDKDYNYPKLLYPLGTINILTGFSIFIICSYILIMYPIVLPFIEEFGRLFILIFGLGYGVMTIWYNIKIMNAIKKTNANN